MNGGSALVAVAVLLLSGQPASAAGGMWTPETSLDDCVDAGVEFFIDDFQRGRSTTYCFEVAPDTEEVHSTHFMSFPNVRPASARVMAANGCHLGVAIPQWEAKRQLVVSAPVGKRRVNDYGLPERYDGRFKTARGRVSCEREDGSSVVKTERTTTLMTVRDWAFEAVTALAGRRASDPGPASRLAWVRDSLSARLWPDAPAPASLAAFLPSARRQMWDGASEGLRLPLHLRFVEARCSSDGGVALVFEEIGPPFVERTYAYAVRGSMPTSKDGTWGGGHGKSSVLTDPEFVHLMGTDTVACP